MLTFKPEVGIHLNKALAHTRQLDAWLKFNDKTPYLEQNLLAQLWYLQCYGGETGGGAIDLTACTVELFGGRDFFFDVTFTFKGQVEPAMVGGLVFHGPLTLEEARTVKPITEHTGFSANT